jgi:hypothetical protein
MRFTCPKRLWFNTIHLITDFTRIIDFIATISLYRWIDAIEYLNRHDFSFK